MKTWDRLRICAMEKELLACQMHRYYGDQAMVDEEGDLRELRKRFFRYLEERQVNIEIPSYYHYWEDQDKRRNLWLLEHDPIAIAMLTNISKARRRAVDGRPTLSVPQGRRVCDHSRSSTE